MLSTTCSCTNSQSTLHVQNRAESRKNMELDEPAPNYISAKEGTEGFPGLNLVIQMVENGF